MDGALAPLLRRELIRPLDAHFAHFLAELDGGGGEPLLAAACLVSRQLGEGHVCVDLREYAGEVLFADPESGIAGLQAPPLEEWLAALRACSVVAAPGEVAPLLLEGTRLYLQRYWSFERCLAERLRSLSEADAPVDEALLRDGLTRLFGPAPDDVDWQRVAAAVAVLRPFAVISGGPGTGKTRTVSRVLALLAEQGLARGRLPRIRLAAPTGKAAARLTESIERSLPTPDRLRWPEALDAIPREAGTLHRLLGARPDRVQFRHDAGNPLHLDVLLVDEASMVDLPLMARLVDALPPGARLILLGDRDQLASVEAGAVLGELCVGAEGFSPAMRECLQGLTGHRLPATQAANPLADGTAFLLRSWRFRDSGGDEPGIGPLARTVRAGDGDAARVMLERARETEGDGELSFRSVSGRHLAVELERLALPFYRALGRCGDAAEALERLGRFRILCALRSGPFGTDAVNRTIRELLGLRAARERWYHGMPVIVTSNDYRHGLYNGDTGIVWDDGQSLRACFPDPEQGLRHFAPHRLPPHEPVYAMTVHKSQGSELERVLLLLPDEPSPVLTRELIYTGLTRARRHVEIWGDAQVVADTVRDRPTRRRSGLRYALGIPERGAGAGTEGDGGG